MHKDDKLQVVLLEVPIGAGDDDVDDMEDLLIKNDDVVKPTLQTEPTIVLDLSAYTQQAGALAVSRGNTFFIAAEQSVLIATRREGVVGILNMGDETPTAVVLGEDGYLYIASANKLFRIRTKEKPVQLPTNKVAASPRSRLEP